MEQDLYNIGIIGAGPAGCCCALLGAEVGVNMDVNMFTLFDCCEPLRTILPTGGGRCNLAHSEFDFKELAKNYPRGEKFLYSVLSKFGTADTIEMFENLGIETYTQEDGRIFPVSDNSKEVRAKFLDRLHSLKNIKFVREKALRIEKENNKFRVITDMNSYNFDKLVFSTGGHSGYEMIKRLGVSIVEPKPSLVGLVTKENWSNLKGTILKNVTNSDTKETGDILITHFGVSGPLIYKISSLYARKEFPYKLSFNLVSSIDDFQKILNDNPHKFIKNVLSEYIPLKFSEYILSSLGINPDEKSHKINGKQRDAILEKLHNFELTVTSTVKDGETVTSGGVDLDKINPKTMESKEVSGLYFCGEVIDVDGFCGGFNLQNCWSTAYVVANSLRE